jgi:Putative Actinobacterial Holin-X, holin superfamily III
MTSVDFRPRHRTDTGTEIRPAHPQASVGHLVQLASRQLTDLVRAEMRLAQAEMSQKGRRFGKGGGMVGGAGLFGVIGLMALAGTVIAAIAVALPVWAAGLIVTAGLFAVAGLLALVGRSQIRRAAPAAPHEAIDSVRTDVAELKERTRR